MVKRLVCLVLFGVGVAAGCAASRPGSDGGNTSLNQIPNTAREALLRLADGAPITAVEREQEHGMVLYEAEWSAHGHEAEAKVTADGDLVEFEEHVDADAVPRRVRAVAARVFPHGARIEYEKAMVVVYEIEARVDGQEKEISVLTTGEILGREDDDEDDYEDDSDDEEEISLDEVPAAARATILAEAKGAQVTEVERETRRDGRIVYEVEWTVNGQEVEVKVAPDGTLLRTNRDDDD